MSTESFADRTAHGAPAIQAGKLHEVDVDLHCGLDESHLLSWLAAVTKGKLYRKEHWTTGPSFVARQELHPHSQNWGPQHLNYRRKETLTLLFSDIREAAIFATEFGGHMPWLQFTQPWLWSYSDARELDQWLQSKLARPVRLATASGDNFYYHSAISPPTSTRKRRGCLFKGSRLQFRFADRGDAALFKLMIPNP